MKIWRQAQMHIYARLAVAAFLLLSSSLSTRSAPNPPTTRVAPTMTASVDPNVNVVWSADLANTWHALSEFAGGQISVEGAPPWVADLGQESGSTGRPSQEDYWGFVGLVRDGIPKRILDVPHFAARLRGLPPGGLVFASQLTVACPFRWKFDTGIAVPFKGAKVAGFGVRRGEGSDSARELRKQVSVVDYRTKDDFVLELQTTSPRNRLFLAKTEAQSTIGALVADVRNRIANGHPSDLDADDDLAIPVLALNLRFEFTDVIGHLVVGPKLQGPLVEFSQALRFTLDETGASFESDIWGVVGGERHPRDLILDKPFLVYIQDRDTGSPLMVLWIGNKSLMRKFQRDAKLSSSLQQSDPPPPLRSFACEFSEDLLGLDQVPFRVGQIVSSRALSNRKCNGLLDDWFVCPVGDKAGGDVTLQLTRTNRGRRVTAMVSIKKRSVSTTLRHRPLAFSEQPR